MLLSPSPSTSNQLPIPLPLPNVFLRFFLLLSNLYTPNMGLELMTLKSRVIQSTAWASQGPPKKLSFKFIFLPLQLTVPLAKLQQLWTGRVTPLLEIHGFSLPIWQSPNEAHRAPYHWALARVSDPSPINLSYTACSGHREHFWILWRCHAPSCCQSYTKSAAPVFTFFLTHPRPLRTISFRCPLMRHFSSRPSLARLRLDLMAHGVFLKAPETLGFREFIPQRQHQFLSCPSRLY